MYMPSSEGRSTNHVSIPRARAASQAHTAAVDPILSRWRMLSAALAASSASGVRFTDIREGVLLAWISTGSNRCQYSKDPIEIFRRQLAEFSRRQSNAIIGGVDYYGFFPSEPAHARSVVSRKLDKLVCRHSPPASFDFSNGFAVNFHQLGDLSLA